MKKILNKGIDELNSLLIPEYKDAMQYVYGLLVETYAKIIDKEGVPQMSHLYQYDRYYTLLGKINSKLNDLGIKEDKLFTKELTKMYEDTAKIIGKQLSISTDIDEEKIRTVLQTPWIGQENYSDRIWKNKAELVNKIKHNLVQSIITGQSLERFSTNLSDNLVVSGYYPIRRLAVTEMNRMHLQSTVDKYKEAGITKVKIITAKDNKVCGECKEQATKEYDVDKILNVLPTHANCRCSIVAKI